MWTSHPQTPTVSHCVTSSPKRGSGFKFWEIWRGEGGRSRGRRWEDGQGAMGVEDQLEVSEWTLPGPSVGEVTDEGVGASCQPPFAWEGNIRKRQKWGWVCCSCIHYLMQHTEVQWMEVLGAKQYTNAGILWSTQSSQSPEAKLPLGWEEKHTARIIANILEVCAPSHTAHSNLCNSCNEENTLRKKAWFQLEINIWRCCFK